MPVRKGVKLKMSTIGTSPLMVAARDKDMKVLGGREASAAKGKLQLVPLVGKKSP